MNKRIRAKKEAHAMKRLRLEMAYEGEMLAVQLQKAQEDIKTAEADCTAERGKVKLELARAEVLVATAQNKLDKANSIMEQAEGLLDKSVIAAGKVGEWDLNNRKTAREIESKLAEVKRIKITMLAVLAIWTVASVVMIAGCF